MMLSFGNIIDLVTQKNVWQKCIERSNKTKVELLSQNFKK